ncbi:MAG: PKD domain-containing protein [Bacteroidia bacterium]|nr:PKD domain-containing protein [Bacteroidia bacterium]
MFRAVPFERKAFIENKDQFKAELPELYQNFNYCIDNGAQILFTKEGLTHVVKKINHKKIGTLAIFMSEEKREELEHEVDVEFQYINMKWLNANPNVTIEVSDEQITTYNYFLRPKDKKNYTESCKGYNKLTYKNLYNGIDVEYFFTEKGGFKYNLIVSEGADLSQIEMQYDSKTKLLVKDGNIIIKSLKGDITDHAPITYLTDSKNEIIPSKFVIKNNIISFLIANPDKQAITIDPWTLTPVTANPAYDNGVDATGNVYLSGGTGAGYYVEKYTPLGVAIWSMLSPVTTYYGDMLVETSGNFYVSEGFNAGGARTFKFGPNATPIWTSTTPGGGFREHWRLALNCITNKVIVAGGGTTLPTDNIAEIDVNTGALINIIKLYGGGSHDMSGLCVDELGKSYVHDGISNQIVFTDAANNPVSYANSGYTHTETFSWYAPGEGHGYNMMALGGTTFLFTSDGLTLNKWDRNTYALLGSVAIPGGQSIKSCGILADKCNNLFVGSNLGVYRYDFNLVQKEFKATSAPVYDIAYATTSDIIACGVGFATSLPFGRETCGTLQTIITSNPCNPSINTVTIRPLLGVAPFTFLWDDGNTDSTRINLGPGKHVVVVRDGSCVPQFTKDTVEFKAAKAIRAIITRPCFGSSNGQLLVWLTQGQKIITYTITPSITNSQINDSTILGTALANGSYTFQLVSDLGCALDTIITLTQFSAITTSTQPMRRAVCPGQATGSGSITVQGGGSPYMAATSSPYSYSWNTIPTQTTGFISGVIEGTYVVTVTDSVGCTKKDSVKILANPLPQASFVSDTVCLGKATSFLDKTTITSGGLVSWGWAFGGTSTIPTPTSTVQNPTFTFNNCSAINNATLVVVSDSGCLGTVTRPVIIRCLPVPGFTFNNSCKNGAVQFTNTSANGVGTAGSLNYLWNLNPSISSLQNPINTYTTSGIKSVSLTVIDVFGCTDSVALPVTIYELPVASFSISNACLNSNVVLGSTSTIALPDNISSYSWNFGLGSVPASTSNIQNPTTLTYNNSGIKTITLTVTANTSCTASITNTVTIYPQPIANFSTTSVCQSITTVFTDLSTTSIGSITAWDWDFTNDGLTDNTSGTPTNMYPVSGTYTTGLVVTTNNNCKDTVKVLVNVWGHSAPDFNMNPICFGTAATFTDNTNTSSQANTGTVTAWNWNFGDGSGNTNQNPNHVYSTPGNSLTNTSYSVQLVVTTINNCKDSITKTTMVYSLPTASFTSDSVCLGSSSQMTDASTGNGNVVNTYTWDFSSNGSVDIFGVPNPTFIFPSIGNNNVSYTVSTSPVVGVVCSNITNSITVWVNPNPTPDFTFVNACINAQPNMFDASSSTIAIGTNTSYFWAFGDGGVNSTASATTTHIYAAAGVYQTTLTATSNKGCQSAITKQVEVYEKPYMTISATQAVCLGASTGFTANILSNSGPVNQWLWDMNSNIATIEANGQQPSFVFTSTGTKTVRVIGVTTNGCRDTVTRNIYINYIPDPQFLINKPSGCPLPHCVTFSDNTPVINGPSQINNWNWSFGDGNTNSVNTNASQKNCYTNSSSSLLAYYTVSLKVTTDSSCSAVKTQTNAITVYPKPIANYVVDLDIGTILQPLVHFTNQSQDYTKWWWYYGDLSSLDSLVQNPTHSYDEVTAQTYATYLIVSNQYRCKDTAYMQVEIGPEFVFYIPNAFSPNDDGVNDFFTGKGIGIEKFELWVFDRWGEMICYSDDIAKGWDGKVQGKSGVEKQDVYIWKVKLKDVLGKKHEYVGHVTLLR